MEETKEKMEGTLSYEQLREAAVQMQQRLMVAEGKLNSIDYTSIRLNWLFKVIENRHSFDEEFADKCSKEIQEILTLDEETENTTD